jgi:hypothetical protein
LSRLLRAGGWLTFAIATVLLAFGSTRQRVDPTNRALKRPDSQDARQLQQLGAAIPDEPVVLLGFVVRGEQPMLAADREALAALRTELAAAPGVVEVYDAPLPDPGLVLLPVALRSDDLLATARQVVELARRGAPPACAVLATGLPLLEGTIADLVAGERLTIVPILVAVLLAAALAGYRHAGAAIAVLLPALCAIAWTSGTMAWLGHPLDPIAALLDPVLLTIGVAASVHFVEAFRRARADLPPAAAVQAAAANMQAPALLATATTMIGLWSLTTSETPAVADFGLRSALGVGLANLFTFLLLPSWLPRWCQSLRPAAVLAASSAPLATLARHRLPVLTLTAALSALAAAGLFRVTIDNDPLQLLPADEPARLDHDALAQRLGGVETFHLLLAPRSPDAAPAKLLPFLAMVRQLPGIAGLAGPVLRGTEGALAVPLLLPPGGSATRAPLFTALERTARVLGFDDLAVAGRSVQIARDSQALLHGLLGSLGLSFALLALVMMLGLRSWRLGLLGILPNALPSLWLYGGLGWLGRPVSVATAMIGCTMLGLIVDNTLHLLHHYRHHRHRLARADALQLAFGQCARAMGLSSVVLMLGFGTTLLSRLETTREFGGLAVATIALAFGGSALVLPALLLGRDRGAPHG